MNDAMEPTPRGLRLLQQMCAAVVAAACVAVAYTVVLTPEWVYDLWADRDLLRTERLLTDLPTTGAELSFGGGVRIPGGLQYYLMALPLFATGSAVWVYRFQAALFVLGGGLLARELARRFGAWPAAAGVGLWFASPITVEIVRALWNPGFVHLFAVIATLGAVRFVADRDPRALVVFAGGLAAAAQMHLSAWLLLGLALPALVAARVPGTLRQLPFAFATVLLVYLPHVVDEVVSGFPNTTPLLAPGQIASVTPIAGVVSPAKNLATLAGLVFDTTGPWRFGWTSTPEGTAAAWLTWVAPAALCASALGAAVRVTHVGPGAERRLLGLAAGTWALALAYFGTRSMVDLSSLLGARYALPLWPLACVLLAWGVHHLGERLGRRAPWLVGVVVIALTGSLAARAALQVEDLRSARWKLRSWKQLDHVVTRVREETGWSLTEVAGRSVLADTAQQADAWTWTTYRPVDWILEHEGSAFPGSLPPPCALVLPFGRTLLPDPAALDAAFVARVLDQPTAPIAVNEVRALDELSWLVLYTVEGERCRTAMVDRYVDTPVEAMLRRTWPHVAVGTARELAPPAPDTRRFLVVLPGTSSTETEADKVRIIVGIDLRAGDGAVDTVLHGNQLRGMTYNGGWLALAALRDPALKLREVHTGQVHTVPLAVGLVGNRTQIPPLAHGPVSVPSGTYAVSLVAPQVVEPQTLALGAEVRVATVEIALAGDVEVR